MLQSEPARSTYSQWQRVLLGLYLPVLWKVCEVHQERCGSVARLPRKRQGQDILQAPGTALVRVCVYNRNLDDSRSSAIT